ncbi:MAG TPA: RecQ family ATP-dependent DNA helicase [Bryobacteraceae bacterium]|jgi:ATP-dependent DNA helicase RecQ|nr:RecQ family ATP-dependent DNA helicase [Bryobacteraceae bacterium]
MTPDSELLAPLRRYWGYDGFRPMQERIVRSLLAGRDACVVMPTGGGKSLCYQLPALVLGRTAVVISPLIALMQDQAAQLAQMGIPAAVLNSAMPADEQSAVVRKARAGQYRLLYLSPERLARPDTIGWLQRSPIAFFAIDEAHCISEWGHEFRPEYRQLSALRQRFPEIPIAAFTASATRHVRHDILQQLQLRDPDKYIVSFHRPNLRYLVQECDAKSQARLMLQALRAHSGSNVIIYAPTIARVDETVDFLAESGVTAIPYHGKMDTSKRRRNQERWMSDEVPVLVGTLAFGLGINKAAVRAVIHLSLPKSIEQYYQEAGRAGRDGAPADCALLWRKKDVGLLAHFIDQLTDPAERERAWQRYHTVRKFAESARCRHRQICLHFGETPKWESCGMCDVCGAAPEWLSAREPVAAPSKRKRGTKPAQAAPPMPEPPPRREPSPSPMPAPAGPAVDPELREYLREWRRIAAQRQGVPAYVVLHDSSLDDLCRRRPSSLAQLLKVSGFGERKAELYGEQIFAALEKFAAGARASAQAEKKVSPADETMRLLAEGKSFEEIARIRDRQLATVVGLVADLVEKKKLEFSPHWVAEDKRVQIGEACQRLGLQWLKPLKEALPEEITFEEIRLVVADLRRKQSASQPG